MGATSATAKPIGVGIIGAGLVSQVVHLPTLALLSDLYNVVAICDVSRQAIEHAQQKFHVPHIFTSSEELVRHADVQLVIVASADEYHCLHTIQAADAGKDVLVEKPLTLMRQEAEQIEQARIRNGVHIFVGYMRRYTPVFAVFLQELQRAGRIDFARVFDYPGPNSTFVAQSATSPKAFVDDIPLEARNDLQKRSQEIALTALGNVKGRDARLTKAFRLLGSLGSHDISAMRHAFGGVPSACTTAFISPTADFIGATFVYDRQPNGNGTDAQRQTPFQVSYETGIHAVATFDAYIEVYCERAVVALKYDTPFVKGLPIFVSVRQNTDEHGYEERKIRPTFVDAYTAEFTRLHAALQHPVDKSASIETLDRQSWATSNEMCSPTDALKDLDVFDMIMAHISP